MIAVLGRAWALLLGMMLLQVGNGMQGTLIGVRGEIEGFSTFELSLITSGYFLGFLGGSRMTAEFIRRVGHVRVFAALGSFTSAALILYPAITDPYAWIILRVIVGFCLSGLYVTAESWLNDTSTNETRGQALSLYMILQMAGIVAAQGMINVADPAGYILFIIPSVLVSISFAPILLSVSPAPAFATAKPMSIGALYSKSPLAFVGMLLLGGVFSAQFGMSAVYAVQVGLSVAEVSAFVASLFIGALILQYPIGWLSDRMDRRILILVSAAAGCVGTVIGLFFGGGFVSLLVAGFLVGGVSNPLYSLLIAYLNDYLEIEEMASAAGGLVFVNGLGAIAGPLVTGWIMGLLGPQGFWVLLTSLMAALGIYTAYRMTQRPSVYAEDDDYEAVAYTAVVPGATPLAVEVAQEVYIDNVTDEAGNVAEGEGPVANAG
ncbi:MAG: MFS transporter [Pseudomonadota bacterium]